MKIMKHFGLAIFIGLALIIGLLGVSAQVVAESADAPRLAPFGPDNVIAVTTTADENGEGGACSLREAIKAANTDSAFGGCSAGNGADSITLPAGDYLLTVQHDRLQVSADLTINGAGAETTIIDAGGSSGIFDIVLEIDSGVIAEVNGLTIAGGYHEIDGAGIRNFGSLTLNDSIVRDNHADYDGSGGGIYNKGALAVNHSIISDNIADEHGGGIHNAPDGTVLVSSSTISGNSAINGGGLFSEWEADAVTIFDSTFSNNSATNYGGAILRESGELTINNSTLSGNQANEGGGLYALLWDRVTINHSTLTANYASLDGDGFSGIGPGQPRVKNTIFKNSYDTSECSGPIGSEGYNIDSDGTCHLDQPTDLPNTDPRLGDLKDNGGGIETHALLPGSPAIDRIPDAQCKNADGTDVVSDQRGVERPQDGDDDGNAKCDIGAYEAEYLPLLTVNTELDEFGTNDATCSLREAIQSVNWGHSFGGCNRGSSDYYTITVPSGHYLLTQASIEEEEPQNAYGDLNLKSSMNIVGAGADTTEIDAGGLYRLMHIKNSGPNWSSYYYVRIKGVTLTGGDATESSWAGGSGGAIRNIDANLTLDGVSVQGNVAETKGGGIYNERDLTVIKSTISVNTAQLGGGLANEQGVLTTINTTFSGNVADEGGGVWSSGGNASMNFTTLVQNKALVSGPNIKNEGSAAEVFATIIANPTGLVTTNCGGDPLTSASGFNRISDTSCQLQNITSDDLEGAVIALDPLRNYGGPTQTHMPSGDENTILVDIMSNPTCINQLQALGIADEDQRGMLRPAWGIRKNGEIVPAETWKCDAGAVEPGTATLFVCGPPLLDNPVYDDRCTFQEIDEALKFAQTGDTIVVSGVVSESVEITKSVTIRGPKIEEATPGTHMGIVQGALEESDQAPNSVFTIMPGAEVKLENLNIRHGDATLGGGVNNGGELTLNGVMLYDNQATDGGGVYNSGVLTVKNSTIYSNTATSGGGIYNAATGTASVIHATLADNAGGTIHNANAGAATVVGTILSTGDGGSQCSGQTPTSGGWNLVDDPCFTTPGAGDRVGDPKLGPLRDNGGPTLTLDLTEGSDAVENGPPEADCAAALDDPATTTVDVPWDQRGKQRPFDMPVGGDDRCDIGAVEYGKQTWTVCENCDEDPENRRFNDLQKAINYAMADDIIAIEAGSYTGNFIAYKDATLEHADIDVTTLSPDQPVDVRAILQASERTIPEQYRLLEPTQAEDLSGTVLTVVAFYPTPATGTIALSDDVSLTLQNLTIQHGLSREGGGIYNHGQLDIIRSTLADNAALNELGTGQGIVVTTEARGGAIYNAGHLTLTRSTISGNLSEYYGGAIYNAGTAAAPAEAVLHASTVVDNKAARLPTQFVIAVDDGPVFDPDDLPNVYAGDTVQFHNRTGEAYRLLVEPATACNTDAVDVPRLGMGLSAPLICNPEEVTFRSDQINDLAITITFKVLPFTPEGHVIYAGEHSEAIIAHSILGKTAGIAGDDCAYALASQSASIDSGQYNLADDATCGLSIDFDLWPGIIPDLDARLGPLQDNNAIDFVQNTVSGYTYSHALKPGSSAMDRISPAACGAVTKHVINLNSGQNPDLDMDVGDIVSFESSTASTVALRDGEADVILINVPVGEESRPLQLTGEETLLYRVYHNNSLEQVAYGQIVVHPHTQDVDQRGVTLPQRGTGGIYACDMGAYEFQRWVVGQPVLRPPSAIVTQPARWNVGGAESGQDVQSYHAWSSATAQDYALRPSPNDGDDTLEPEELVAVYWDTDPDPAILVEIGHYGVIEWPDDPQIHVSDAGVALLHEGINDGFQISGARAFEGRNPADADAGQLLVDGVFRRTTLPDFAGGESYSVLQWVKGNQTNATLKVEVVKTVDWNTSGVRDMRDDRVFCEIGRELRYRSITDEAGTLPGHEDTEGKAGQILAGDVFDGIHATIDQSFAQNTVDDLIPPAHNKETREGPIIPILNVTPNPNPTDANHDLEIAWYRPNDRNVAWPMKAVGYVCGWPDDPPEIVIASELGSEIGGQAILEDDAFSDLTIYHQPDPDLPGYSPNWEHALLADSNLGNPASALYALRTDLMDRDTAEPGGQSYALLKYHDPLEDGLTKIGIYKVVLTRAADEMLNLTPVPGIVTLNANALQGQAAAAPPNIILRVDNGNLTPDGEVTLPLEALGAKNLHSISLKVTYDVNMLTPSGCTTNRGDFVEQLYDLQVTSDSPQWPYRVVHFRASLAAGTDAQYLWDFGDGTSRIAGAEVSHVYGSDGDPAETYTVMVTAANGVYADLSATTSVTIDQAAIPGDLAELPTIGCRIEQPGELTIELQARAKHGHSGDLRLSDLSFTTGPGFTTSGATTEVGLNDTTLYGPGYEDLRFNITAGNPVYAPTPMRGLLDIQPCEQTKAENDQAAPFWKDWKGMLWARAAGDMRVLYYYPLQPGFYLDKDEAIALTLVDGNITDDDYENTDLTGQCVPWLHKDSQATEDFHTGYMVYPVAYHADWPDLPPLMSVGETVYERAKSGISGVANQLAVSRIYDDLAPGAWDSDLQKIVLEGAGVQMSLAQLIDPIGELREHLDLEINDNWSLPTDIKTERLLFGGGQAIVGNKNDPNLTLPFSLRSRVLFDDSTGDLIFRGYYDGTSKEYIKGDPLFLLNVMSTSDRQRLYDLCPGGDDCDTYKTAIEALYWKTLNPRQLNLCRDADGKLYDADPEPAINQGAKSNFLSETCEPWDDGTETYRDSIPDQAFLIGVQDTPLHDLDWPRDGVLDTGDGMPEPYEGLGKGKALTAGNAAGTGYITVTYNNDPSLGGLPVSLQVIKVGCTKNHLGEDSTYRGNLLVINSDNMFDEKLTLRHTGDFGGRPDDFEFEWYIAEVDDTGVSPTAIPPNYPWRGWTKVETGASAVSSEITIEGANPTTLSDNWLIARYKNYPVCGNQYRWSAFAGDPSAKPSEVRAQFAPGWIKRVTSALNPFDTRVDDFISAPVNTTVDMVRQAGPRYEGPVALSNDPETINNMGLIEAYETILDRGRKLSIDSSVNHQGANAALLNVTSRIANLYMLLGNDAVMDALDPTVGMGSTSAFAARAPTIFAFMNQFRPDGFGLIDEELALLRGRDEILGGVAAAPTYNRLTWNFTNGDGEVAYVLNYNIKDMNQDGFLDEADAAILYPQGHGDAWGQMLTAISKYYQLLRHPHYTWSPRAEPIGVAGAPVVVDYYDERRFAIAASAKARMGGELVDLTYRKHFAEPDSQEYEDSQIDASDGQRRAWGVADWARRSGQGAYLDWVVANAIIPPEDDRYTDVRKIDRTTVVDLGQIADEYAAIQQQLDEADGGVNPLGLVGDAVLFDLDPAQTKTTAEGGGKTHFEQVYDRTLVNLGSAFNLFDYANEMKIAQRESQDSRRDFVTSIIEKDTALMNELIELFGYPYDADIGVNGTYPEGYEGPDIYNYDLWDRIELTDAQKRCGEFEDQDSDRCQPETETILLSYYEIECLGAFPKKTRLDIAFADPNDLCISDYDSPYDVEYRIGVGLDAGRGRFKPQSWPENSARSAPGEIQNMLQELNQARLEYEMAILAYDHHLTKINGMQKKIKEKADYLTLQGTLKEIERWEIYAIDQIIRGIKMVSKTINQFGKTAKTINDAAAKCPPRSAGLANDVGVPVVCTLSVSGSALSGTASTITFFMDLATDFLGISKDTSKAIIQTALLETSLDYQLQQYGKAMGGLLRQEHEMRLALWLAKDRVNGAQGNYDQTLQRSFRKLNELSRLRKRWAGQISEQRYYDMAYRIFQNDALHKYRKQFDIAQTYTYLTAAAYDYETNLAGDDPAEGDKFLRDIVGQRSLGELRRWQFQPVEPVVGSGGLADPLGRMHENFEVLKGQMGFNNPQSEANRFSLRSELFRLRDDSDAKWKQELMRYYTSNIYSNDDVARLAKRPYGSSGPQPGLVIPIASTITEGQNFFARPLGPGDSAYDASQFSTKIANVGVWFEDYDTERLAQTPRVYLLPAGKDVGRPRNTSNLARYWNVTEQLLPVPYPITQADMEDPDWTPLLSGIGGELYKTKPYTRFRAYPFTEDFNPDEMNTDTRLIGRTVWNTEWLLVIPGSTLLSDPDIGIERFIEDVDDIHIYFQTYAYAGTMAAAANEDQGETDDKTLMTSVGEVAKPLATASTSSPTGIPLPSLLLYGTAMQNGQQMESGALQVVLPRGGIVEAEIAPISGTGYNYLLSLPLSQYAPGETNYAASIARLGETINFQINNAQAMVRDVHASTSSSYGIPSAPGDAVGMSTILNPFLSGGDAFPLGDVDTSGARTSTDAMLVLQYDIGLIGGDDSFPAGPGKIYLPLCDIVADGQCNASDALRILLCDVGMAGISCPASASTAAVAVEESDESAADISEEDLSDAVLLLRQTVTWNDTSEFVTMQVLADDPSSAFGAATLEMNYDPVLLQPESCFQDSEGALTLALCNLDFAPGVARFNALTTEGVISDTVLAKVKFRVLDPTQGLEAEQLVGVTVNHLSDRLGGELRWQVVTPERIPPPEDDVQLFLPLLLTIETVDVVDVQPEVDVSPEVEVPEEIPTAEALNLNQHLYLPHLTK